MPQEISASPRVISPSLPHPVAQPWSASNDAEQLMDEVFVDIDRLLAGGASLPETTAPTESMVALQPLVVPPISLPPGFLPNLEPTPVVTTTLETTKTIETGSYFDRLLLGAALAAVGASGVLWLVSKDILKLPFLPPAPTPVASQPSGGNLADAKFIDYMQRSLSAIDKRPTGSPTALQSGNRLPAPGGAPLPPIQAPPTVLERVYIPVFPPQNSAVPISPGLLLPRPPVSPSPRPSVSVSAKANNSTSSNSARPEAPPPAPAPALEPEPPRAARPAPENTAPPETPAVASSSPSNTASGRTLIGILELGDNSAALFDINGDTQRVAVGETIGGSGWTLVKVENQQAIVRRNGVVQSLYVGGRF